MFTKSFVYLIRIKLSLKLLLRPASPSPRSPSHTRSISFIASSPTRPIKEARASPSSCACSSFTFLRMKQKGVPSRTVVPQLSSLSKLASRHISVFFNSLSQWWLAIAVSSSPLNSAAAISAALTVRMLVMLYRSIDDSLLANLRDIGAVQSESLRSKAQGLHSLIEPCQYHVLWFCTCILILNLSFANYVFLNLTYIFSWLRLLCLLKNILEVVESRSTHVSCTYYYVSVSDTWYCHSTAGFRALPHPFASVRNHVLLFIIISCLRVASFSVVGTSSCDGVLCVIFLMDDMIYMVCSIPLEKAKILYI